MWTPQVGRLLTVLMISLGLTACGSGKVPPVVQTPPITLAGNWLLAGSRVPAAYPVVSASLAVEGNVVTGEAAYSTQCTSGTLIGTNTSVLPINGTIANDGTFQASTETITNAGLDTVSLSLSGKSPLPATPSVWTGTYSLTSTPGPSGNNCVLPQTAPFTAAPIASVTGTYIGVPASGGTPFGVGSAVSVQIVQGAPTVVTLGSRSSYVIPLTANLTIASASCPYSGSTTGVSETSSISGDSFDVFLSPGSPVGVLSATLNDATAHTFSGNLTSLANAIGCPGIAFYNFTRQ